MLHPAYANNAHHMVYEVYAGGIHAVQAKVDINFGDEAQRYDAFMGAKTRGFLGKLIPWTGTFESHGWVEENHNYKPQQHKSVGIWKQEKEVKDYQYNRDGTFASLTITDHDKSPYKKDVDAAVTDGTIDILTATMKVMNTVADGEECTGSSEVFDGKRRFEMAFVHEGFETLEATKYNIYSGKAARCTVEVKPISGGWHSKPRGWLSIQEQGRARGTIPTLWMGTFDDPDGSSVAVPVKIRVKTAYGTLFMHLAEYRSGDEVIVAKKRVLD